ncbi:type I methionyl aminopeptidase [Devriesea agamarum]|uniref:type I methionyl aminopeptidase n=1 Tax=Devriesea agamarum TaxID=472569 RepID=UPI00071D0DA3|nr:type I methionyl aminopeptidase [Devriesea agamarum]
MARHSASAPVRTPQQIEAIARTGRFVADTLSHLRRIIDVGWNLLEIDAETHRLIREAGAESCYIDYHPRFGAYPFGKVICTSVNDSVLHGRPYDYVLRDGDLLSLDFAVSLDGWVADSCLTIPVGTPSDSDLTLIRDTETVLWAGIDAVRPHGTVEDIGYAVHRAATDLGYRVNAQFGGHGVGQTMHEEPFVPNRGRPGHGVVLPVGSVITVEPFLMRGTDQLVTDADGWTLRSKNGARGAHAEHTVVVTEEGARLLTERTDDPSPRSTLTPM